MHEVSTHFAKSDTITTADREGPCRDYLRGVCDRHRCKFKHDKSTPIAVTNIADMNTGPVVLNFCHDYQNNSCPRPNCRFIHCTPAEEDQYKHTGELPLHLQADAIRKHQLAYGSQPPVCKNFLNGDCRRGSCKFRHINRTEHEAEIRRALKLQPPTTDSFERTEVVEPLIATTVPDGLPRHRINFINGANLRRSATNYNSFGEYGPPDIKRRFFTPNKVEFVESNGFDLGECEIDGRTIRMNGFFNGTQPASTLFSRIDPRMLLLEEENNLLHKQLLDMKKQVSDLTATNEFLLDQNAQLRVSGKRGNVGGVTSVTVPAVTITNTTVPQINTSAPPPQQMIRTVTASVATVPVSIATVTTRNHPVSIGAVSMAPVQAVPSVSIAQPATQQLLAQSQQLLSDPALTLASNTTQLAAIAQQNLANNLAAANQPQMTSQVQQIALATTPQQLTSQAQQLAMANTSQQLLAQQTLANTQQMALTASSQLNSAISTSQAIAMSNATQPMVSYPIMTQSVLQNGLQH